MTVVCASNNKYVAIMTFMLKSLIVNHKSKNCIYVTDDGIKKANKEGALKSIRSKGDCSLIMEKSGCNQES